jgi:hypothetical protein
MPPSIRPARARSGHEPTGRASGSPSVLYVEGPRDRDVLRIWCERHRPGSVGLVRSAVILGGRQPNRAVEHFRTLRGARPDALGLCVLDRDDAPGPPECDEPGLEVFTWGRRHLESYLLVATALRRVGRDPKERFRLERFARESLPPESDEPAWRRLDAKRLLEREGPLHRALGRPLAAGSIARSLRGDELHGHVVALLDLLT